MKLGRYRVRPGARKPLDDVPTDFTGPFDDRDEAREHLADTLADLAALQEKLYAQRSYALLVVLQGMDTAGKDGVVKHVLSGLSPSGVSVHSFKQPSSEELAHDFLWRVSRVLPERGQIAVFNRSYYEEVLVVRVHPQILEKQNLPEASQGGEIWEERFDDIRAFERHLWRNGTILVKCFLHISKGEQERRLLARIDDPSKSWKFSAGDLAERAMWKGYVDAYQAMLSATSTRHAPWYVVPADHKWFARAVVADIICDTLSNLDLRYPPISQSLRRELANARRQLTARRTRKS